MHVDIFMVYDVNNTVQIFFIVFNYGHELNKYLYCVISNDGFNLKDAAEMWKLCFYLLLSYYVTLQVSVHYVKLDQTGCFCGKSFVFASELEHLEFFPAFELGEQAMVR